jgi:hypothetical protein
MDNQNTIQDELRSLNSSLPANNQQTPFSVPEGYFEGLAGQILAKAKGQPVSVADELQQLSPLLAGIPKITPYELPEDYFDNSNDSLPFLVNEVESPVLAAIGKNVPYTVPENYFGQLPNEILAKLPRPKTKVVPFFSRTWMKVAVAAVIGGIVFIGGYRLLSNNDEAVMPETARQKADTTRQLMAQNETATVLQDITSISTSELDEFMKAVPLNPAKVEKPAFPTTQKSEVNDLLKGVSEKEIDAFLEQLPTADETLSVID